MAAEQTILFTVLPRAVSVNAPADPLSIFVTPRLDGADNLGAFADWLHWTRHLRDEGLELELQCGAKARIFSNDHSGLRPDLWEQLFNADTFVRSHASFDDYSGHGLISFSVRNTLSVLKSVYQRASVTLALPDPPSHNRSDDRPGNRQRLAELVNGLQKHWDGREAVAQRRIVRNAYSSTRRLGEAAAPLDSEGLLLRVPTRTDLSDAATPFSVFHHMPTPPYEKGVQLPDAATLIDFHQALTSLNAYPELLRALGLVLDLDVPADFITSTTWDAPGSIAVRRIVAGWVWAISPKTHPLATAYMKISVGADELFFTAPRSVAEPQQIGAVLGLLDLDSAHFGLAQVDVDGAMHKAIMLAETLFPSGAHNRDEKAMPQVAQHPEVFDPEATLPSLRSGGFSLFADDRALTLLQSIHDTKAFNDAIGGGTLPKRPFYAEDLIRGYRLDVWDSRSDAWHSLHEREGRYVVGDIPFDPTNEPEEGFVELAATQPVPAAQSTPRDLYLHEAIARWAGWSLSVPRPGQHLSRYANAKDAIPRPGEGDMFTENPPVTPFRVSADYKLVPGSLPALRFGVRYRVRARAVDLAGNSLRIGDPLAANLAGVFALPQDPEGFTYLRFEPVPAPLVVVRDEAAVTAPGSAVDRLVIRTFNDEIAKDGEAADISNVDRHIIPPRAAIEMGERSSTFDDATGKLKADAATWKLIADRDGGELQKRKIAVKGRVTPVPDDGSDEYPVEPGERIDPLPFFPDPLSRGAALRDLPGTPSATVGRAVPDLGAAAPVDYNVLDDPNPRPGSATLIGFGDGDWQQTRGFRFVLADPAPKQTDLRPNWDPAARVLTVYVPKGQTHVVPLTSYMSPTDLHLMGVWQWLRQYVEQDAIDNPQQPAFQPGSPDDRIAHVLQRTVEGGHWMLTPPHLLTLVHAVQQPIGRPEFTGLAVNHAIKPVEKQVPLETTPGRGLGYPAEAVPVNGWAAELATVSAWRRPDSNEAYLLGALKIHGASSGRIDLLATWEDPLDDLSLPAWTTTQHAAQVDELALPALVDGYLSAPLAKDAPARQVGFYEREHDQVLFVRAGDAINGNITFYENAAPRHLVGDTKHHVVTYTATASSRYREYFDPTLDAARFTRASEPLTVDVPASARPLAPSPVYVIPTFGWERQTQTNLKRSVRFGGGLRVYLERPWFSSGTGELLGVALWSSENGELNQASRNKFKSYFTQWGMDPIWETAGLSGSPARSNFPGADDGEDGVALDEVSGHISVAGFAPQYDDARGLWFADVTIDLPSETYMPFIRLALVRYQPRALALAKVSRVVLADFAQLTPDRCALITADPHHPRTLRVVVSGVAPRGPAAVVKADPPPALVSPRPTQIGVRVQMRDNAIPSDLAWDDVPVSVASVTAERDGPVAGDADLALWAGTVLFAQKPPAGTFRLVIEEHELLSANYTELDGDTIRQPRRLVYAEIFVLDDSLVTE